MSSPRSVRTSSNRTNDKLSKVDSTRSLGEFKSQRERKEFNDYIENIKKKYALQSTGIFSSDRFR